MAKIGFFHVGVMNYWEEINKEIFDYVKNIGLLNSLDKIIFGVVGLGDKQEGFSLPYKDDKFEIGYKSPNLREFEYATTQLIENHCINNPDDIILHFHNSGVKSGRKNYSEYNDPKYPYWRWWEMHHTLNRFEECIEYLKEYDACGIEIQNDPWAHFSGTWWWANASYINQLISVEESKFYNPDGAIYYNDNNMHGVEFWISQTKDRRIPKFKSLCQSGYHWIERQKAIENYIKPQLEIIRTTDLPLDKIMKEYK